MAAGDIKGPEVVVIYGVLGATTTKGQVINLQADGKWDPVATGGQGKFGVALEAGVDTNEVPIAIWGRVEVTDSGTGINKGDLVMAADTGEVAASGGLVIDGNVGTAMEAIGANGTGTVWIGLVG
jgi:hypothetical protein